MEISGHSSFAISGELCIKVGEGGPTLSSGFYAEKRPPSNHSAFQHESAHPQTIQLFSISNEEFIEFINNGTKSSFLFSRENARLGQRPTRPFDVMWLPTCFKKQRCRCTVYCCGINVN